jgi:CTP synthase
VPTIYEVPLILEEKGIGKLLVKKLGLKKRRTDLNKWRQMVSCLKEPCETVTIALVGKYVELEDAYYSVREALCHAGLYHNRNINLQWIHSEDLEKEGGENLLRQAQGIIVPGGFGLRGIEGMIKAATYARENKIPYLGLCLGMQVMVIEFARHVLGVNTPHSAEFDEATPHPVIDLLPEQQKVKDKGGTMRLGIYPCKLVTGSRAAAAYKQGLVHERHRHRYEFNNEYRAMLAKAGMIYSGLSPNGNLVEVCEIDNHPWMVSCQFHPEFGSRPGRPHPLFRDFIGAAKDVLREGAQPSLPLKA